MPDLMCFGAAEIRPLHANIDGTVLPALITEQGEKPPAQPRPDPEVVANAKRRTFTSEYKLRILTEANAAAAPPGAIGALQRREGLYSSHLVTWRRERKIGMNELVALREGAELAKQFSEETIGKHQAPAGQITIYADRGKVMTSKPVAFLMADLGVTKTPSRPLAKRQRKKISKSPCRCLKMLDTRRQAGTEYRSGHFLLRLCKRVRQ